MRADDCRLRYNAPAAFDFAILSFEGQPFEKETPFRFQYRLPEIGEEVAAIGYPQVAYRNPTIVMHTGTIEALPISYPKCRFIQTSFQSGGGLSGGPLVDKKGLLLGLMIENVYMEVKAAKEETRLAPTRPYGQAFPFEYVARVRAHLHRFGETDLDDVGAKFLEITERTGPF